MAFDDEHQQYLVRKVGWNENKVVLSKTVLHLALRDGKISIEEIPTEEGIAASGFSSKVSPTAISFSVFNHH